MGSKNGTGTIAVNSAQIKNTKAELDKEFLNENNIADGAELMDDKYGLITYASGKIPVSEVTILRRRKNLPVDRRRKI